MLSRESGWQGKRVYYSIGGDWQTGKNTRMYWQLGRESGSNDTKEIGASVGLKYRF